MKIIVLIAWLWVLAFALIFIRITKKKAPTPPRAFKHDTEWYARACYAGNAQYRGVQEVEGDDRTKDIVLFNASTGSTLGLEAGRFSAVNVLERVKRHEKEWSDSCRLV